MERMRSEISRISAAPGNTKICIWGNRGTTPGLTSRFRTGAISSAPTVSSPMPGGESEAGVWTMWCDEVEDLAENGYKEVVLTGIHLSSYGIDFDGERHLLPLIRAVHAVDGD